MAAGGYLIEKTKSGADPDLVLVIGDAKYGTYPGGTTIPAHGFYLIVRDDASQTLRDKADAIGNDTDFTWTGKDYTLYLGNAAISSDDDPDIIDKVGFGGSARYYESSPAPEIPEGKSLQRKVSYTVNDDGVHGPAWDSDDNSADFFVQDSPNPTNSAAGSANPMYPIPEFTTSTSSYPAYSQLLVTF